MGQAGFLCVLLLRRQDGWVCAKLDGWVWTATILSLRSPAHPFSADFVHPYYVAPGSFRERPENSVVRGASWASFRGRGWRLLRLRGGARRGLRMGSVSVLGERLHSA